MPDSEWICFRALRLVLSVQVVLLTWTWISLFRGHSSSRSRAMVLWFQDGIRTPSPFLEFHSCQPFSYTSACPCPSFSHSPSAMAASTNVQLSIQIQRSLQARAHPFDSALVQQTSPSPTTSDFSEASVSLSPGPPVESFGPPAPSLLPPPDVQSHFSGISTSCPSRSPSQIVIAHPYARLYAKKNATGAKRRKIWNHALEKSVFSAHEMYVDIIHFCVITYHRHTATEQRWVPPTAGLFI